MTDNKSTSEKPQKNHSQLAKIFASAMDAVIGIDSSQTIVYFNQAAEEIFGYTAADVIGQSQGYLLPERFRAIHAQHIKQFIGEGSTTRRMGHLGTLWALRANEEEFPIEASLSKVETDQEMLYVAILRDITERKQVERTLQYQALLLQNISDAVITTDLTFNIQSWNSAAESLYGWREEEVLGQNMNVVMLTSYFNEQREAVVTQFRTEGRWQGEVIQQHKDGHRLYVLASVNIVRNEMGQPISVLAVNRDIMERKQAEERVRESEANLQAIFNNTAQAFVLFDKNGRILVKNSVADRLVKQMTGREPQLGDGVDELFVDTPRQGFWEAFNLALQGQGSTREARITTPLADLWFEISLRPIVNEAENVERVSMSVLDVTKRRQAEASLQESEEKLRLFIEHAPASLAMFDRQMRYLACSHRWKTDYSLEADIIGHPHYEIFPEVPERWKAIHQRGLAGKVIREDDDYFVRLDGNIQWLRWEVRPWYTVAGVVGGIVIFTEDITNRKHAQEELRRSQTELQHVLHTVPEGVILLDADRTIRLSNPVADKLLTILDVQQTDGRLIQLGNRPLVELLTSPPAGLWHEISTEQHKFEAIAKPVEISIDNSGWVLMVRDVTQERQIQEQAQLQERLAAIGQLAAGIAHDFNNIMAVITLYAQLIARTVEMPARAQGKLRTITQQAERATDLIQQILDFSRQSVLERQALNLVPFMKELVKLLGRTLPENIQIRLEYEQRECVIHADPSRIQQVIMNLALNARDAMPTGGLLQVNLAQRAAAEIQAVQLPDVIHNRWVEVKIEDNGNGMAEETLSQIFEPFFTTKEVGKGTGLGLAQVYGIVQQHNGFIDVQTRLGRGTTFLLYFPVLATNAKASYISETSTLQKGQGQTILLVEDEATTREALLESLTLLNYEVVEAVNGRHALEILQTEAHRLDLIVSDVVMPEMGGSALFHTLRHRHLAIPVILLTGHPMNQELENLQALGLAGWMQKPPHLAALSRLIAQVLVKDSD